MLPSRIVLTSSLLLLPEVTAGPLTDSPFSVLEAKADECFLPSKLGFLKGSVGKRKFLEDCESIGDIFLAFISL